MNLKARLLAIESAKKAPATSDIGTILQKWVDGEQLSQQEMQRYIDSEGMTPGESYAHAKAKIDAEF